MKYFSRLLNPFLVLFKFLIDFKGNLLPLPIQISHQLQRTCAVWVWLRNRSAWSGMSPTMTVVPPSPATCLSSVEDQAACGRPSRLRKIWSSLSLRSRKVRPTTSEWLPRTRWGKVHLQRPPAPLRQRASMVRIAFNIVSIYIRFFLYNDL